MIVVAHLYELQNSPRRVSCPAQEVNSGKRGWVEMEKVIFCIIGPGELGQ